jgi:tetratricopeptide (TPR) repeat protein
VVIVKLPALAPGAGNAAVVTAGAFVLAVGLVYAAGTVQRGKVWASDLVFWEDGVAKSPNEGLAHLHLGLANANLGRDREAEKEYLKAIDPSVDYDVEGRSIALNNLGMLYMNEQDFDKADEYFDRSIRMRPDYPTPYYGMGVTALRRGERLLAAEGQQAAGPWFRKSEQSLRRALELNPQYVKAHNQLAFLLINTGRAQEASRHVEEVLRRMASGPEHDFALRLKGAITRESAGSGSGGGGGGRSGDGTR